MTIATFKIGNSVRCAVEVPAGAVQVDLTKERDEVVPIVLLADSTRQWNLTVAWEMIRDMGYRRGPVVFDLMLLNGPKASNRFMQATFAPQPNDSVQQTHEIIDAPSEILVRRCNILAQRMIDEVDSHILTQAQVYAVRRGLYLKSSGVPK